MVRLFRRTLYDCMIIMQYGLGRMHQARLIFQDGAELAIPVGSGQTLLEGALALNAPLRYDCCAGTCGSCVVQCVGGETRVDMANRLPVSTEELAAGFRPACLT